METLNENEPMQKVKVSFKATAIMDFPISQDISNLSKEDMELILRKFYKLIDIKIESVKKL